jgi:phosphoribosylglycinamide formyltransferase 1
MTSAPKKKFAALISGRGSNMASLLAAAEKPDFHAEPTLVLSNKAGAPGLSVAERAGVPTKVISHRDFASRAEYDATLDETLKEAGVDIICLAGFMRLFTEEFVTSWTGKLINIHPSLLPSFPGLNVQQKTLDAGVRVSGCTVHFVDAGTDTGPIIGQAVVPIDPNDDDASLSARILGQEHKLYPRCLDLIAQEKIWLEAGRVRYATDFRIDQSLSLP